MDRASHTNQSVRELLSNYKIKEKPKEDRDLVKLVWWTVDVPIVDLRFTQDSVAKSFSHGDLAGLHILFQVVHLLFTGEVHEARLATLVQDGWHYACNNRTLTVLKIYARLSRALMKWLLWVVNFTEAQQNAMQNKVYGVGQLRLVPYFTVRCVTRYSSEYSCSHPVECHGTPLEDGVLSPESCQRILVRGMDVTSRQISRVLVKMFLVEDVFSPTFSIPLTGIPRHLETLLVNMAKMFRRRVEEPREVPN